MTIRCHRIYGLNLRSELPLYHAEADISGADVQIKLGDTIPSNDALPLGRVLSSYEEYGWPQYTSAQTASGSYLLRYHGVCDFAVTADLAEVVIYPVEGSSLELVAVLATGGLLSFVLMMSGAPVLHASAVEVSGQALAFVGYSGMGKSTMAALVCAEGARLITDDVLRLDLDGDPRCHRGATEVRLRRSAVELSERFTAQPAARCTGDDRTALDLAAASEEVVPLAAIAIPNPDRAAVGVSARRLGGVEGLLTLVRYPRLLGWQDGATQAAQFQHLGTLSERVPVFEVVVPWGPPFGASVARDVLQSVGMG